MSVLSSGFGSLMSLGQVVIPPTVEIGPFITAAITALAAVVTIAVGGYVAFMLVRRALRWLSLALR